MARSESPLETIRHAEQDLQLQVEKARRRAEDAIQAARDEAEHRIALADHEGQAEADACYRREIELARQEAEAMVVRAQDEADAMRLRAMVRMDEVVRRIVELVLPQNLVPG